MASLCVARHVCCMNDSGHRRVCANDGDLSFPKETSVFVPRDDGGHSQRVWWMGNGMTVEGCYSWKSGHMQYACPYIFWLSTPSSLLSDLSILPFVDFHTLLSSSVWRRRRSIGESSIMASNCTPCLSTHSLTAPAVCTSQTSHRHVDSPRTSTQDSLATATAPPTRSWTDLPLEIRHMIIRFLLEDHIAAVRSCFFFHCNWKPCLCSYCRDAYKHLGRLLTVGYSFGQDDIRPVIRSLKPRNELHTLSLEKLWRTAAQTKFLFAATNEVCRQCVCSQTSS